MDDSSFLSDLASCCPFVKGASQKGIELPPQNEFKLIVNILPLTVPNNALHTYLDISYNTMLVINLQECNVETRI